MQHDGVNLIDTGLPAKDETSETTVKKLFRLISQIPGSPNFYTCVFFPNYLIGP